MTCFGQRSFLHLLSSLSSPSLLLSSPFNSLSLSLSLTTHSLIHSLPLLFSSISIALGCINEHEASPPSGSRCWGCHDAQTPPAQWNTKHQCGGQYWGVCMSGVGREREGEGESKRGEMREREERGREGERERKGRKRGRENREGDRERE